MRLNLLEPIIPDPIPTDVSFLVTGSPGSGKTILTQNLVAESIRQGIGCLYITTTSAPEDLREQLARMNGKEPFTTDLVFVDMYSWLRGEKSRERYYCENLYNIPELSILIQSALANFTGKIGLLVFESISTLLSYGPADLVIRLLRTLLARQKMLEIVGFYTIEEGIHEASFYNEVRSFFDGVIEIRLEDELQSLQRWIRLHTLRTGRHRTNWFKFLVEDNRKMTLCPEIEGPAIGIYRPQRT